MSLLSYIRNIFIKHDPDNPYIPIINNTDLFALRPDNQKTFVAMNDIVKSIYMWVFNMEPDKEIKIDKLDKRTSNNNYDCVRYMESLNAKVSYFDILSIAATCRSAYSEWNNYKSKLLHILHSVIIFINIDNIKPLKFKIEMSHYINHVHYKSYETSNDGKGSYCGNYIRSGITCWSISGIYSHESKSFRTYEDVSRVIKLYDDLCVGKKGMLKSIYEYHKKPGLDLRDEIYCKNDGISHEWPFAKLPDIKPKKKTYSSYNSNTV